MTSAARLEEVNRYRAIIARGMGLSFDDTKVGFLADVLRRRSEAGNCQIDVYLAGLEARLAKPEIAAMARELTVPETYFFRNSDQFRAFTEVCLPERMRARGSDQRLRFLSAGCASGEEAYSLAILAREHAPSWDVRTLGIDVNPSALEKARRARYSSWAFRETTPDAQRRWFRMEGSEALLDDGVRGSVGFEERNLVEEDSGFWQEGAYDVVFCRNVLMYLTPAAAKGVMGRITRALVPGGYLFLGHAETLRGLSTNFHLRDTHGTFYYQARVDGESHKDGTESPRSVPSHASPPSPFPRPVVDETHTWIEVIQRASDRVHSLTQSPRATVLSSSSAALSLGVALDLLQKERFSDALDVVGSFPLDARRDPDVLLLHAVLLTHSGRLDEAEGLCSKLLQIDELNAGAHYVRALCREGVGDRKGALEEDRVAVYLDPTFAMARLHMGLLARKTDDRETARKELAQALVLLEREDPSRLLLFGGGFGRDALIALCRSELVASGGSP